MTPVALQRITVHVVPGARQTAVVGAHGDALKVKVMAPPVDGKANALLQHLIADTFGLPGAAVTLVSGTTSRRKTFALNWPDAPARVQGEQRLAELMQPPFPALVP